MGLIKMCEFKVFLDGEKVFDDAIYAQEINGKVLLKSILGETREEQNCHITKVDVSNVTMILSRIR